MARALLLLVPILTLSRLTGNEIWLQAAIVGLACQLTQERAGLAPFGMLLQGLAIIAGYLLLVFSLREPPLFVITCTLMAAGAIRLDAAGRKLRTIGNFTYIPSLYLACEISDKLGKGADPATYAAFVLAPLPYMLATVMMAIFLAGLEHLTQRRHDDISVARRLVRLANSADFGAPSENGATVVAVMVAVVLMTTLVEWQELGSGQWAIWSAVSVATAEVGANHQKLGSRVFGACVGVPVGICLGSITSHSALTCDMAILGSVMTLVALKRYIVAVTVRYGLTALAITLSGQTASIAAERIVNVIIGGCVGIICAYCAQFIRRNTESI
ncbi:FUSC family protein [Bradyrhizobium sp. NAS80.1]|uniref:FUSC family protein n=1 Tax=Bradyrhizobium sp. NAS80.1 TaxID=1680159 RepID=UPI00143DAE39|nr:FUSC family protein [Bradyrhizobium sp. NAS80.1]